MYFLLLLITPHYRVASFFVEDERGNGNGPRWSNSIYRMHVGGCERRVES